MSQNKSTMVGIPTSKSRTGCASKYTTIRPSIHLENSVCSGSASNSLRASLTLWSNSLSQPQTSKLLLMYRQSSEHADKVERSVGSSGSSCVVAISICPAPSRCGLQHRDSARSCGRLLPCLRCSSSRRSPSPRDLDYGKPLALPERCYGA